MPSEYEQERKKKKKKEYTGHERRLYNQYARHALAAGKDVEDMDAWIEKKRKKKDSGY